MIYLTIQVPMTSIIFTFQKATGRACSGTDLLDLKKQRIAIQNFISRTLFSTIGNFDLFVIEEVKEEITQEEMIIKADKKLVISEMPVKNVMTLFWL